MLRNSEREFDLVADEGKEFQRREPGNFKEREPYWEVLAEEI